MDFENANWRLPTKKLKKVFNAKKWLFLTFEPAMR
jgi:hypothetical protein